MRAIIKTILSFLILAFFSNCNSQNVNHFKPKIVYQTDKLVIIQISNNSFMHTSFLQTNDFGNVPCNGLIVKDKNETIIYDTPTDDIGSEELIKWIEEKLDSKINAIIPTHFHNDCLGGLQAFHNHKIPSYANIKTIELAKANNYVIPQNGFESVLILNVGNEKTITKFFGEGHTKDNVVGYFPIENIMFGGCLIKEISASKGYLGDANVDAWSNTVRKVKNEYPDVNVVVPGHGEFGNKKLLDYTVKLFETK
ncbi:MAG: subclass B1 metallo-beta-lactamase [Cruoricaptor ignavus]|nr:subclass B1 metallo-beta-lactamase [Cruoricaptor ignavus]